MKKVMGCVLSCAVFFAQMPLAYADDKSLETSKIINDQNGEAVVNNSKLIDDAFLGNATLTHTPKFDKEQILTGDEGKTIQTETGSCAGPELNAEEGQQDAAKIENFQSKSKAALKKIVETVKNWSFFKKGEKESKICTDLVEVEPIYEQSEDDQFYSDRKQLYKELGKYVGKDFLNTLKSSALMYPLSKVSQILVYLINWGIFVLTGVNIPQKLGTLAMKDWKLGIVLQHLYNVIPMTLTSFMYIGAASAFSSVSSSLKDLFSKIFAHVPETSVIPVG